MEENNKQSKPKRRYKKRVKKVTPTEGLLTDANKEIREIPMYDPYTGEPNPYYEELTGKPNPLLQPKGFTIDDIADKARKDVVFGIPSMNKNVEVEVEPTKDYLDVKTNNRFLVVFPKEFGITPFHIKSIQRPHFFIKKSLLGRNVEVSPVVIELIDLIQEDFNLNIKLNKIMTECNPFNFRIETVNPKGLVVEEMLLAGCYITEIKFSPLSYDDDNLSVTTVTIHPKEYNIR